MRARYNLLAVFVSVQIFDRVFGSAGLGDKHELIHLVVNTYIKSLV